MISPGKTFGDHSDIGFRGENSISKTVFIKSRLLTDLVDPSKKGKSIVSSVATEGKPAVQ